MSETQPHEVHDSTNRSFKARASATAAKARTQFTNARTTVTDPKARGEFIDRTEEQLGSVVDGLRDALHAGADLVSNIAKQGVTTGANLSRKGANLVDRYTHKKDAD